VALNTYTTLGDGTRTQFQLPNPLLLTSDVISVTVNGGGGPAVSSVAGDLVNLATAPAAGSTVAIIYKDRRVDGMTVRQVVVARPSISYSSASHQLSGYGIPGFAVDVFVDGVFNTSGVCGTDGSYLITLVTYTGTKSISAKLRKLDNDTECAASGACLSSVY
jgi:hypothetical protein